MKTKLMIAMLLTCIQAWCGNDKYRLILTTDPATTMTIAWNQISGEAPIVYYGTDDFGTNHMRYPKTKTVDRAIAYRGMENRFVRLTGLQPNTNYYFVIRDSEGTSDRFWFHTAPDDKSRLSFIAGGDSRNNREPKRNANLLVSKLRTQAVFFGGDMTADNSDQEWQNWFDDWQLTIANDGRMTAIVPTRGNHEGPKTIYNLFDTPTKESYYAVTFGDGLLRSYILNSEISVSGNQLDWLRGDLANNMGVRWKMAQYHKPMRPRTAAKTEGNTQYNAWAQLFYGESVRLVVECDSHMVKTTWPVQPSAGAGNDEGFKRNDVNGTVYIEEGCWGAPLRANNDDKEWTRSSGSFNQFKLLFVDESKIEIRTIKVDNAPEVGEISDDDPFNLPANLDVWKPPEGSVVEILPAPAAGSPQITFARGTPTSYSASGQINLDLTVLNEGAGIAQVDFFVDGVASSRDESEPYSFTHNYGPENYTVEAIATDINNQKGKARFFISVGTFSIPATAQLSWVWTMWKKQRKVLFILTAATWRWSLTTTIT